MSRKQLKQLNSLAKRSRRGMSKVKVFNVSQVKLAEAREG